MNIFTHVCTCIDTHTYKILLRHVNRSFHLYLKYPNVLPLHWKQNPVSLPWFQSPFMIWPLCVCWLHFSPPSLLTVSDTLAFLLSFEHKQLILLKAFAAAWPLSETFSPAQHLHLSIYSSLWSLLKQDSVLLVDFPDSSLATAPSSINTHYRSAYYLKWSFVSVLFCVCLCLLKSKLSESSDLTSLIHFNVLST